MGVVEKHVIYTLRVSPLLPQDFGFSEIGELQFEDDLCLDVSSSVPGKSIQIYGCHGLGGNQKWEYNVQVLLC